MPNPHHIDLLINETGNIVSPAFRLKAGTNSIHLAGVLNGCTVTLEVQPKGSTRWYSLPAGTFTESVPTTDDLQFWINSNLPEGSVRGVITNAGGSTDIEEFILRPVIEYEYEV